MKKENKKTTKEMTPFERAMLENTIEFTTEDLTLNVKLSADEKQEIIKMCGHKKTISFLVDQYYQSQAHRIRCQNQIRSLLQGYDEAEIDHPEFIKRELSNALVQEALNKKYMDVITSEVPLCKWMKSIYGIGPVFSAYLYSVFDIERGHYATEFLSYAGLNDNNNPWLGETKANEMVKNVIEWRDKQLVSIEEKIQDICGKKLFSKFKTQIKKLFKLTEEVYIPDIIKIANEVGIEDAEELEKLNEVYGTEFQEWCNLQAHTDYAGDMVFSKISELTTRKPQNIKKGTMNIKTKGKQKEYPNVAYLKSYLAKPPYNLNLKKQCYLISDNFVKQSNREKSLYGRIYKERKLEEIARNERGDYAEVAKQILESKNWSKDTITKQSLMEGKLSAGHLDARAKRYAVKLFISHVHEAMYYEHYKTEPPKPYVIEHLGHHDYIAPEVDYHEFLD